MRFSPPAIQRENALLRRELGTEHDHARYQWVWSEDLQMPMVIMDKMGTPIYDFWCNCGKNVTVHQATCRWTVPRQRWEIRKLLPDYQDQWVLARWVKPEESREDWEACFGTQPYPADGYLIPVSSASQKTVAIAPGQIPLRGTTEFIIQAIKEHFSVSMEQRDRETKEEWDQRYSKKRDELEIRCKDAFPVHMGLPGEKQDWSAGGFGESPVLRKGDEIGTSNEPGASAGQ